MPQLQARGNKWTNKTKFVWKKRKKKKNRKKVGEQTGENYDDF